MASRLNDEVILSKIILSHFCPKQANEWIGGFVFWIIKLFIAILTWTNLTYSKKPYSQFFHPPFLLFIFWKLKNGYKKEWGPIIELFIACLAWPNLMCFIRLLGLLFQHLTPPVGGPLQIFERSVFERTTYRAKTHPERTQLQQKITFGISGSGSINQGNTHPCSKVFSSWDWNVFRLRVLLVANCKSLESTEKLVPESRLSDPSRTQK
jgi:hypothetical protein